MRWEPSDLSYIIDVWCCKETTLENLKRIELSGVRFARFWNRDRSQLRSNVNRVVCKQTYP